MKLPDDSTGPQTAGGLSIRERVQARTRQLALLAGRAVQEICQRDYEQAKRELTGETDLERQNAVLDDRTVNKKGVAGTGAGNTDLLDSAR